jgi:hypothetical protein
MTCTVAERQRVREAAAELRAIDGVVAADARPPGEATTAGWSLSLVMDRPLQPAMQERLAAHGLAVPDVSPRGEHYYASATA